MENSTSQHIEIGWKKELLDGCREKTRHRSRSPGQKKKKYHRLSSDSSSSSSSSSSGRSESSSSSSGSSGCDLKKKRNERKEKRDEEKKLKKEKRRMQKEKKKEIKKAKKEKRKEEKRLKKMKKSCKETAKGDSSEKDCAVPIELMFSKARAPETPEAYELRQKQIRRVTDPETGRTRLIKGDGEILEEIVSKDRHREINKYATKGDGDFFQRQTVGWQMNK